MKDLLDNNEIRKLLKRWVKPFQRRDYIIVWQGIVKETYIYVWRHCRRPYTKLMLTRPISAFCHRFLLKDWDTRSPCLSVAMSQQIFRIKTWKAFFCFVAFRWDPLCELFIRCCNFKGKKSHGKKIAIRAKNDLVLERFSCIVKINVGKFNHFLITFLTYKNVLS